MDALKRRSLRLDRFECLNPWHHHQARTQRLFFRLRKSYKNVTLHENERILKTNAGQFFHSLTENLKSRRTPQTSLSSFHRNENQLMTDVMVLQPNKWLHRKLDIQQDDAEVLRLCDRLKVEIRKYPGISGIHGGKGIQDTSRPEASTSSCRHCCCIYSECERAFSSMNDILPA